MPMRSYHQFCPAARALDVVGERWTLLVVRELLVGPKRYTDLQGGLPGIGPNVLAERLRALVAAGLAKKRRLPPPAASSVYELTERGAALRPVMLALFQWGLQLLGDVTDDDAVKASYWLPALQMAARRGVLPDDVDDVYEFHVGEETVTVVVHGGSVDLRPGSAESPDLVLRTNAETFAELGAARLTPGQAVASDRLQVEGDPSAAERCAAIFATEDERLAAGRTKAASGA
jgi:DNA-binding HxlR family transcriptional regulator/putative sterol carrier protein